MKTWRFLDTGVRTAAENMALDRTILLARSRNLVPDTFRFLMFSPPAVLAGYHQCVSQEIRESYCREAGFDINRRITGGGALFFNKEQLGWEVIASADTFSITPNMVPVYRKICNAAVAGLKRLGIEASFRPRNDIEVHGRKISGTGGTQDGNAFLFQGTLLLEFDIPAMLKALMIPVEKIQGKGFNSVAERMTWLVRELSYLPPLETIKAAMAAGFEESFGIKLIPGELTPEENDIFQQQIPYFKSDAWINRISTDKSRVETYDAIHKAPGGLIRAAIRVDEKRNRITTVIITGDFFIYPSRFIYDLESRLRDIRAEENVIESIIDDLWREQQPHTAELEAGDFSQAVIKALEKSRYKNLGFTPDEANKIFPVGESLFDIIKHDIPLMLLPYCSKLVSCKYRELDECPECGKCTIGAAYALAREAGMEARTILSFEHLMQELYAAREHGVLAFIGCCCRAFYHKHYRDFLDSCVPGILVDIESSTCYDLGKVRDAYAGTFKSQTHLNLELLKKVLDIYNANHKVVENNRASSASSD